METYFHGLSKEEIVELLPDTIYLPKKEIIERLPWIAEPYKDDLFWDECYIRKEALLGWANKRLEEFRHIAEISNDVAADGEVDAFEELIDKLSSL